jgi:hypothetical protein
MGHRRPRHARTAVVGLLVLLLVLSSLVVAAGMAAAAPLDVNVGGENGTVRETEPGLSCADDGEGSYRHYFAEATLAPGVLSQLAGTARTTLDVHYDGPGAPPPGLANAYLLGTESHVTLANERGAIQILLRRGTCAEPGLNFDGVTASLPTPGGSWSSASSDVLGSGAYRGATGSGTFGFTAEMNPGADNTWALRLAGSITVLQPGFTVVVDRVFWGNLGLDYLSRVVTVVYRVGNPGAGDSFGARFTAATAAANVKPCGEPPSLLAVCPNGGPPQRPLGDLASCADATLPAVCDSELVTVRYQIPLLGGPCGLVILGCQFATTVHATVPDALDVAAAKTATVTVRAPDLPPPL